MNHLFLKYVSIISFILGVFNYPTSFAQMSVKDDAVFATELFSTAVRNRVPLTQSRFSCKFNDARVFLEIDPNDNISARWNTKGDLEDACEPSEDMDASGRFWTHSFFRLNDHCEIRLPKYLSNFYREILRPSAEDKMVKVDSDFNPAVAGSHRHLHTPIKATLKVNGEKIEGVCIDLPYQTGGAGSRGN